MAQARLSVFHDELCSLWDCRRRLHGFGQLYCPGNNCEELANQNLQAHAPHYLGDIYTHYRLGQLFLPKILYRLLNPPGEPGVPDFSDDPQILSLEPWLQPHFFNSHLTPREDFGIWIFRAVFAPHHLVWRGGHKIVYDNYVRRIFRPRNPLPNRSAWILHRYTLVNDYYRAFYTLQYWKPPPLHPPLLPELNFKHADDVSASSSSGYPGPDESDGEVYFKQTSRFSTSKRRKGKLRAPSRGFPISSGRNNKVMDRSPERMEGPPSAVLQQKVASKTKWMDMPEKGKHGSTYVLRSKLWEILGNASPANNQDFNSESPEVMKTNFILSQGKSSTDVPKNATRSLLQRRFGATGIQKRTKAGANIGPKEQVFRFGEGLHLKTDTAMNSGVMPKKQRSTRPKTRKRDEAEGIWKEMSKRSSFSDKRGSSHELHPQSKAAWDEDIRAETAATPESFHGLSKKGEKQERPSTVFMQKSVKLENEFQSPVTPFSSPSPCFSPEATPLQPRNISPTLDETPIFSFVTKKTSQRTTCQASDTERRLLEFLGKKIRKRTISDDLGDSPLSSRYNSPETAIWSNEKSKLGSKRNSNLKGTGGFVLSPSTSLSTGTQKTDSFQHCSETDEDAGLGRAVALFALDIKNYEKKLKSAAEKKSSEIIASVFEEIRLELENVKSNISTEPGNTSNRANTKRKHAQRRVEDFKCTTEGLEADHSELKGSIKKQRTSHQKLIAHFEGGIETKLENAVNRIYSLKKSVRGKMLQLKMIVAEGLRDD